MSNENDLRVGNEIPRRFGDDVEGALDQLARMHVGDSPRVIDAIDGVPLQARDAVPRHVAREGQPEVVRQSRNRSVSVDHLDGLGTGRERRGYERTGRDIWYTRAALQEE